MRPIHLALLGLLASGCGDGDDDTSGDDTGDTGGGAAYPACQAADGHATELLGASVSGDTLTASVAYGGGCETHAFSLCWPEPSFAESEPVQVWLELLHEGPDDPCDAWITEEVELDLAPLEGAWQDAYQAESGTITVHLAATDGSETVAYSF